MPSLNPYFVCFSAVTQADKKSRFEAVSLVLPHFEGSIADIAVLYEGDSTFVYCRFRIAFIEES